MIFEADFVKEASGILITLTFWWETLISPSKSMRVKVTVNSPMDIN